MILKFQLNFTVDEADLNSFNINKDTIFIGGSAKCLGNWNLNEAVEMKLKSNLYEQRLTTSTSSLSSNSSTDTFCEINTK
jgi:hypothetical protein